MFSFMVSRFVLPIYQKGFIKLFWGKADDTRFI